jgi:hypothetical protein
MCPIQQWVKALQSATFDIDHTVILDPARITETK